MIKKNLRKFLPAPMYQFLQSGKNALARGIQWPNAIFHPWRQESIQRLKTLQDQFQGKRCFVIGNGPSLKVTDVSLLKNEYTFGMNRVYLAFQEWGFKTSFLVCINNLIIEQCYQDFHNLDVPKFFSWHSKDLLYPEGTPDKNTHFLFTTYTGKKFATQIQDRFWEGATVTYVCLQLAFCMGFEEVILIGVDHSFTTQGKANQIVISPGDDQNHFDSAYFGKGFRWQLPDLEVSEIAYQFAKNKFQSSGRQVMDATIDGKLTVFPKVKYQDLF